uniref:Uncharacterized protein n=1 Tax=Ditylenchus dipsaci TaxID=166011 RepID=A0A915D9V1_9BILA
MSTECLSDDSDDTNAPPHWDVNLPIVKACARQALRNTIWKECKMRRIIGYWFEILGARAGYVCAASVYLHLLVGKSTTSKKAIRPNCFDIDEDEMENPSAILTFIEDGLTMGMFPEYQPPEKETEEKNK